MLAFVSPIMPMPPDASGVLLVSSLPSEPLLSKPSNSIVHELPYGPACPRHGRLHFEHLRSIAPFSLKSSVSDIAGILFILMFNMVFHQYGTEFIYVYV